MYSQDSGGRERALALTGLDRLRRATWGSHRVCVGLVDGPIDLEPRVPPIAAAQASPDYACSATSCASCRHGTLIAHLLAGEGPEDASGLCPGCDFVSFTVFGATAAPSASADELAAGIAGCVRSGARVVNLSLAVDHAGPAALRALREALDAADRQGVLIVAAAGNDGLMGPSPLTSHPGVIPVVACDLDGRSWSRNNLSPSIARRGLSAPGEGLGALRLRDAELELDGTSVAATFVTAAAALLWSLDPDAPARAIREALLQPERHARRGVVPPLLDAAAAYQHITSKQGGGSWILQTTK